MIYANFGEQKSNENGIFCENRRMLSDEIDEEKRGTEVPRTRRRKSQPARWGAGWSSERSSYRVIEKAKGQNE